MLTLESALRLLVIGQEFLIAAVFLSGSGSRAARVGGAVLMLSVVGYLYISSPGLGDSFAVIEPLAALFALAVPFALWFFARAVFEAPWPNPIAVVVAIVIGLAEWGIYLAGDIVDARIAQSAFAVVRVVSLAIVAHALSLTIRGRPDDLIERRRSFRLFFVGILSVQVAAVLIVELTLSGATAPAWLDLTNVIIIAVLTIGLAIPMLRLNSEFFETERSADAPGTIESPDMTGGTQGIFCTRLLALMDDGYYRETGLTIPMLARRLDYPEHRLRRMINGHLGYRNFSAFLNSYRIDMAKTELADPDKARTPVLTIALGLGYASLGPFNRAFKSETGMTPTAWRQQHLQ
ncbi:MAG: helix-turn-helix domain-containing protein [Woeseiaceae bacterium]